MIHFYFKSDLYKKKNGKYNYHDSIDHAPGEFDILYSFPELDYVELKFVMDTGYDFKEILVSSFKKIRLKRQKSKYVTKWIVCDQIDQDLIVRY